MIEHDLAPAKNLAAPEGYFLEGLNRLYSRPVRMNALRIVAASALAGWLAAGAGLEHPLWASMGAIAAMQGLNYKQTVPAWDSAVGGKCRWRPSSLLLSSH